MYILNVRLKRRKAKLMNDLIEYSSDIDLYRALLHRCCCSIRGGGWLSTTLPICFVWQQSQVKGELACLICKPSDLIILTVEIWCKSFDLHPVSTDPDSI